MKVVSLPALLVLAALSAFGPFCIDTYLPALPQLADDLGASASATQATLGACLAGLAAGQIVAGPLSDARGRRPVLLGGLLLFSLASLACALAPSIAALIGLRFLQGCAAAPALVIARAVVRDRAQGAELARLLSLLLLINGAAPVLAPLAGAQLLRVGGWSATFVALALLGVGLVVASAAALPETLPRAARRPGGIALHATVLRRVAGDRRFLALALTGGLSTGAMFAYIAGSPFVLQEVYGMSAQTYSALFALNAVGIGLAGAFNRRLLRSRSPAALLGPGVALQAASAVALLAGVLLGAGPALVLPLLFVGVACIGTVQPNAIALALDSYGDAAGSASAIAGVLQYAFGAIAAPLVGIAGGRTSVPMAALMALLTVCALVTARAGTRDARA